MNKNITKNMQVVITISAIVILLGAIPTAMAQQAGYNLTVNVTSWTFGHASVVIEILTANGYSQYVRVNTAGGPSYTFSIPPDQGSSVKVCVPNDIVSDILDINCQYFTTTGSNMTVNMVQQ